MAENKGLLDGLKKEKPSAPVKKNVPQRWAIVGVVGVIGLFMLSTFMNSGSSDPQGKAKEKRVELNPSNLDQQSWQQKALGNITELQKKQQEAQAGLAAKDAKLKELEARIASMAEAKPVTQALLSGVVAPPVPKDSTGPTNTALQEKNLPPVPPKLDTSNIVVKQDGAAPKVGVKQPDSTSSEQLDVPKAQVDDSPLIVSRPPDIKKNSAEKELVEANAQKQWVANKYFGMLPAGAFMKVTLGHGLDAGTSQTTQSNPQPILLNVMDLAILPGDMKYNLKKCFILASGYGDLSAERVYGRTANISCMDKQNKLMLTATINGYLVDSDGSLGLRGEVQDRQGAKLAKATLAGFAQGLASALGSASSVTSTATTGTVSTVTGGDALRAAGFNGVQKAVDQLAQFYLKEAQSIFPVISVEGGRSATLVITSNVVFEWGSFAGKYIQQTTPIGMKGGNTPNK